MASSEARTFEDRKAGFSADPGAFQFAPESRRLRSPLRNRWSCRVVAAVVLIACSVFGARQSVADTGDTGQPSFRVSIIDRDEWVERGVAEPYGWTLLGRYHIMCLWLDTLTSPAVPARAFDFLLSYDASLTEFISAERGVDLPQDWEYLSYRNNPTDSACPAGTLRLMGIADLPGSGGKGAQAQPLGGCLVELTFYVGTQWQYVGSCQRIEFCRLGCGDNVITSASGDSLFTPLSGVITGPDYDSSLCANPPIGEPLPVSCVEYVFGAICFLDIEDLGDLNLNSIPYEVGDVVLFINYMIYGDVVWDPVWFETQVFATDINNDGRVLTIADLICLIWIVAGRPEWTAPFPPWQNNPKPTPFGNAVAVRSGLDEGMLTLRSDAPVGIGGACLVYRYSGVDIADPVTAAPEGMVVRSFARDGELRILIYPDVEQPSQGYPAGENELVRIPVSGPGTCELVEAQFSDSYGNMLATDLLKAGIPDRFALYQNFPNPFNASTVIPYSLSENTWVRLEIIDILGRVVAVPIDAFQNAGAHQFNWQGVNQQGQPLPSGMYFCRLTVGDLTQTRKMVLLK